jgi:hypothetical protein
MKAVRMSNEDDIEPPRQTGQAQHEGSEGPQPVTDRQIAAAIMALATTRGTGGSVDPNEVAQALDAEGWRDLLGRIRAIAKRLAGSGRIEILRKGKPVTPQEAKGIIRLRLAAAMAPQAADEPVTDELEDGEEDAQ